MSKKGFVKAKNFQRTCRLCQKLFMASDVKAAWCDGCRITPVPCACGCGGQARSRRRPFLQGHASRIDNEVNRQGHAKQADKISGGNNPSHRCRAKLSASVQKHWDGLNAIERSVRLKNNAFVKNPFTNRYRQVNGYRSRLEKKVADGLAKRQLSFDYEPSYKFPNGKRFYPDFKLQDGTLVEVSGYAYPAWQEAFNKKIRRIKKAGHRVVCVTYSKFAERLRQNVDIPVYTIRGFFRACDNATV